MGLPEYVRIFENSMALCRTNKTLAEAIKSSLAEQYVLKEVDELELKALPREKPAQMIVSKKRTFEAAMGYHGKKVCLLNFASAKNPGGGVQNGASAQEECLCRVSTLFPCLSDKKMMKEFYEPHRKFGKIVGDTLYNSDIIFTPGVICFKTDTKFPELMPKEDWFTADIITCAAPNLGRTSIKNAELAKLHTKRVERIFITAANEGAEVLILGAFGCGAFHNPPEIVAAVMKQLADKYAAYFETIEFAVYASGKAMRNYDEFVKAVKG